ncbi:MAG TPA: hypothetical protein P5567_07925 [Kiritimatiellia bacterium]|nr:hypothetical protein [Kiritimatiellia bacterium]HRZ12367.1 hypothetical protein [Kiritimatiellia bacterium]HSA17875.1 hypothetical protein [Kiritimatiellia bacterium]
MNTKGIASLVLLAAILRAFGQEVLPEDANPFPGEATAVEAFNRNPAEETLAALTEVRLQNAARHMRDHVGTESVDALILAESIALAAVQDDPDHLQARLLLGTIYLLADGTYLPAEELIEEHFESALIIDPDNLFALDTLAKWHFLRGEYDRAIEKLERILMLGNPYIHPARVDMLCAAYRQDEQSERGARFLAGRLARALGNDTLQLGLALMLLEENKAGRATEMLERIAANDRALEENRQLARATLEELRTKGRRP